MAIHAADKIFVDVNDEINFVIEKILSSKQDRIVLAVPQNALIVSSLVSMKILAKQVAKSKKLVIVVTEDRFGMQLAERAGLVSTNKVSAITPEMWEVALLKKQRLKDETNQRKEELLIDRGILPAEASAQVAAEAEAAELDEPELEEEELSDEDDAVDEDEIDILSELDEDEEDALEDEASNTEVKGPIQRKRREAKMISIAGFQIYAGGDISALNDDKDANIPSENDSEMDSDIDSEKPSKSKSKEGFIGRDWRKATRDVKPKKGKKAPKSKIDSDFGNATDGVLGLLRKPTLWVGLAVIIVGIAVAAYVLLFVLASVEIRLDLKTADVPVEQQITANPELIDADFSNLIIPARIIQEDINGSRNGTATGEGSTGEKAGGLMDIWNNTSSEITLPKGTELTSAQTGLVYVTSEAVTLPAAVEDPPTIDSGKAEVRVVAKKFGEEYNIPLSDDDNVSFKVKGFDTESVEGKRFDAISGGTTETFVAVTEKDLEEAIERIQPGLEQEALSNLRAQLDSDEILIPGSEEFSEPETSANPDIGEEADKFTANIEFTATALVIKKSDLDGAIAELLSRDQTGEINFQVDQNSLSGSAIANAVRDEDVVTFTVSSTGSLTGAIDEEELKLELRGKTVEQALDYIDFEVPEVESARILYTPGFIPESLQIIPNEIEKIRFIY